MKNTKLLLAASVIMLSACVAPQTKGVYVDQGLLEKEREYQIELSLQQQLKYQQKLSNAAWPVLQAALPLCDTEFHQARIGLDVMTKSDFPEEYRPAAKKLWGIEDSLQIIFVIKNSPAELAGLKTGDKIKQLNDLTLSVGKGTSKQFFQQLKNALNARASIQLRIERQGKLQTVEVKGEVVCDFPARLSMSDAVNAYADGKHIVITKGMLRFSDNDLEIATVIAHELAHNLMRHIDAKKSNYWLGTVADIAAAVAGVNTQGSFGRMGATAYSQDFESEADYVGVYILALAEMNIEQVANFWRRMAAEHPGGIKENHGASHPSTPQRFLAIEKTVKEIRTKQKVGFALYPDRK